MLNMGILHHQWVLTTLFAGLAVLVAFVLSFLDYRRPRSEPETIEADAPARVKWKKTVLEIPWILWTAYLFSVLLTLIYTIAKIISPPNW